MTFDFTLKIYETLLKELIRNDFHFMTLVQYLTTDFPKENKIVILRHDVDAKNHNSLVFARIQASLGICGTYYFRMIPQSYSASIIKEIASMGHEIGYHYEDLNFALKEYSILANFRTFDEPLFFNRAWELFNQHLAKLRELYPVKTITMHGSPMSRYDNKGIWKKYDYRDSGIICEPYLDLNFYEIAYFTDSGRRWNGEHEVIRDKVKSYHDYDYRSTKDIIKEVDHLPDRVMFTFHPQRWTNNPLSWSKEFLFQNIKNQVKKYYFSENRKKDNQKFLFLLSHPAQFYFYKYPIIRLRQKGHEVLILIKAKDVLADLLDEIGWEYHNLQPVERGATKFSIMTSFIARDFKLFNFARKLNIKLLAGTDASLAHTGKLLGIPCITTLEDDYKVIRPLARLTFPFTNYILTPSICKVGRWNRKKLGYDGYMKLSYLHPNVFTPDRSKVLLPEGTPFFLIRLSRLVAYHDYGEAGIHEKALAEIISLLKPYGKVFISSRKNLPSEFEGYRLKIPVSAMHHYLFYAKMLICDSQSMSVEAALLGTPSIRISSFAGRISVLEELEHKYHLTFGIKPHDKIKLSEKLQELLNINDLREEFQRRRRIMLEDKIDVAKFLTWFFDSYPESVKIMKENPDYQKTFK